MIASATGPVLAVKDLTVVIHGEHGTFPVVSEMGLEISRGETLCILGESGCGKSMTALALLGLLPDAGEITGGKIEVDGIDVLSLDRRQIEDMRGEEIAMIFQEPLTALNPVMKVGDQIAEGVRRHRKASGGAAWRRTLEVLRLVQMPDPERRAHQYPHELSGGMRQRAMIALAIACEPKIIVADEPTSALDVTIQAQILG
ncbi:MAG: ABC transporter ATP-binding protein, partial [Propylenella sp.]